MSQQKNEATEESRSPHKLKMKCCCFKCSLHATAKTGLRTWENEKIEITSEVQKNGFSCMLMVCLFTCLTKRRMATLSWKTRIRLPTISKSQLMRLFLRLQGNVTQCNGAFVGQNRKPEMHDYILRQGAQQLLACKGKKKPTHKNPKTPTHPNPNRERLLFLPSCASLGNHFAL